MVGSILHAWERVRVCVRSRRDLHNCAHLSASRGGSSCTFVHARALKISRYTCVGTDLHNKIDGNEAVGTPEETVEDSQDSEGLVLLHGGKGSDPAPGDGRGIRSHRAGDTAVECAL